MKKIGLYLHIPFCNGKCPYCDFYSVKNNDFTIDEYVVNLNKRIETFKNSSYLADTIYFGGGTPSLLGTDRLISILNTIKTNFGNLSEETTLEVNPDSSNLLDFEKLCSNGVNRISIGLQSANENELQTLGRKHTALDVAKTVEAVRKGGINNISLDLMIGIEGQTIETLKNSINFCLDLDVAHISSYILKIEPGTAYYKNIDMLNLPDDDTVCDYYEFMVNELSMKGYNQYEISNFSKQAKESKHNLKYWNCEEYLGIGASAHSFINGKRFYYGRSLKDFYLGKIVEDGLGGNEEEYIAMQLRLTTGLRFDKFRTYFGYNLPDKYIKNAEKLLTTDMVIIDEQCIRLTPKGFLCSNSIIVHIIS